LLEEYVDLSTDIPMFRVDFGGTRDLFKDIAHENCRFYVDEQPSVGRPLAKSSVASEARDLTSMGFPTMMTSEYANHLDGQMELMGGDTPHATGDDFRRHIPDFDEPEDEFITQETCDSTTHTPFPKVQVSFPTYLSLGSETNTDKSHGIYINDSSGSK
jgi:hypothetical protein